MPIETLHPIDEQNQFIKVFNLKEKTPKPMPVKKNHLLVSLLLGLKDHTTLMSINFAMKVLYL